MNTEWTWPNLKAALIRGFWAIVFPAIGYMVALAINALQGVDMLRVGWQNAAIIAGVSGSLYALKKKFWPDTEF